jgi:putative membrane protein
MTARPKRADGRTEIPSLSLEKTRMTRHAFSLTVLGLIASLAGCGEDRASFFGGDQRHRDASAKEWSGDADFVRAAALGNMTEIEAGRLAQQRATDPQVRQFGERMVTDHSNLQQTLQRVAATHGFEMPRQLDAKHRDMINSLASRSGRDFDRAYMDMMLEDHEKDVAKFEMASNQADNENVRSFAAETLPTLREHLRLARDLHSPVQASH